jgi:hypothetical protein
MLMQQGVTACREAKKSVEKKRSFNFDIGKKPVPLLK